MLKMSEYGGAVAKRKKKLKAQKPIITQGKLKTQQQKQRRKKIQLTQEFEENEKEVMTLLENTSLLSESSNNSHRDEDNKSPSERFFYGNEQQGQQQEQLDRLNAAKGSDEIKSQDSQYEERRLSKDSADDLSNTTRRQPPTLASTFIQIESVDDKNLIRAELIPLASQQPAFIFKPKFELENSLTSIGAVAAVDKNTSLMLNRLLVESKSRKRKIDKNVFNILKDSKQNSIFYTDKLLYKTFCELKFKPIFIEPSWNSFCMPSKKFLTLHIRELRFTEHPLLQPEHRLANNLELLYEHRAQRLQEKITDKLYADLQIERSILNELLRSVENGCKSADVSQQQKKALKIEHHLCKVKALREKLYDEELANKQLLQEILSNWVKLKNLRSQQEQPCTRLKLLIKIEDLHQNESKKRLRIWTQRFEADLSEIYREQLEEYYRCKRLRLENKAKGEEYFAKPRKPNITALSAELKSKYANSFFNPQEPRIDVVRIFSDNEFKDLPGPRKMKSYFMRVFFDRQMVGETRVYRLERDLSVIVNENMGIMLNRSLPKDIRIKLYKKSKISSAQKIANIIVPLPLPSAVELEPRTITTTFSSHKQPISGYLRLNLQSDEELYPNDMVSKLFPRPQQHTTIPHNLLRDWYQRKLLNTNASPDFAVWSLNNASDTEDDTELVPGVLTTETCTFQEDLLQFCEQSLLQGNRRLNLLRSRYLKNNARTRDLKFIPMLDQELEFEWEREESVLDAGNWMDPIDLHKHEAKKYLRNLYAAIQMQSNRLTKVVESRQDLLLNDEPVSWRYSNVRPFIALSFKDKCCRTLTAEGSNPTWNEQLVLQISGSLSDLHDDITISLFDEVIEHQMYDDPAIRNADIHQRIQNNWLGEYRIPINALLTLQKMDAVFEMTAPKILIGYKRPSLENIVTNTETNISIEQFPEVKESVRLWCFLSLEPNAELPLLNAKCLECSELIEVRQHLSNWSLQAYEMQPQRFMEPLICTAEGKRLCITRVLQPLAPPIETSENILDSACRFVSLITKPKYYDPCLGFAGVWLNNQLLLDTTWASPKDLGVLLCNYLLYMGLQCSLILGIAPPYGECTFVIYAGEENEMFFIDPCTGKRYGLKDVFCPLQTIKMVVTTNNFYLNIQTETRVSMMNFNWNDSGCWLPGFTKKNPAPLGGFHSLDYKYRISCSISELKHNIERKIMKKINSWRTMRKTVWNRAFQPRLLALLQHMEQSVTFGSASSDEELRYNNMLADEFPHHKIFGFTLNFTYTSLNQISERIKTTGLHLNSHKNLEYSLAVHIQPYPNNTLSVWLILMTIVSV